MKAKIIEQSGHTGTMEVVYGSFQWDYWRDELAVESTLIKADNHTTPIYQKDYTHEDDTTAKEDRGEALPEEKYAFAKSQFKQVLSVWSVTEV